MDVDTLVLRYHGDHRPTQFPIIHKLYGHIDERGQDTITLRDVEPFSLAAAVDFEENRAELEAACRQYERESVTVCANGMDATMKAT